jgi:hypothetical protein
MLTTGISYASCDTDTITSNSDDGKILIMMDGSVWESLEPSTSLTWQPMDDILECGEKIINTDEDGESVDARKLK